VQRSRKRPLLSEMGQKQTSRPHLATSSFTLNADMQELASICLLSAISRREQVQRHQCVEGRLLDHLVGTQQKRLGDGQSERRGGR
jgi:hypothetical protein